MSESAWIPVQSSNLQAVRYEPSTRQLFVRFRTEGREYRYDGVSVSTFEELLAAPSKGGYFAANIRSSYPYTRLR